MTDNQKVVNNPLGSYPVAVDRRTSDGAEWQIVRLDVGTGGAASPVTGAITVNSANPYITNIDTVDATTTYYGDAVPGSSEASAVWRIVRKVTTATVDSYRYANGVTTFTAIWANRASLSYS